MAAPSKPSPVIASWEGGSVSAEDAAASGWDAASACRPGNLQAYYPSQYRSAAPPQNACGAGSNNAANGGPIQLFYDNCLGPNASYSRCDAFKADKSNAACANCILTPETAPQYGVLITHGGFVSANVAGCLELTQPAGLACAKSTQALADCELAACEANCPVVDANGFAAYSACASEVDQMGCRAYVASATCDQAFAGADGGLGPCRAQSFSEFYAAVAAVFCAAAPPASEVDAGAPSEAGADRSATVDAPGN
ncbi:MAG: hypothetical protein M3O50_18045 [Myxococcota bacterium]|nr:hypothetical protein [Myxococcota bacterium]